MRERIERFLEWWNTSPAIKRANEISAIIIFGLLALCIVIVILQAALTGIP